jgi:hypothetical protein
MGSAAPTIKRAIGRLALVEEGSLLDSNVGKENA